MQGAFEDFARRRAVPARGEPREHRQSGLDRGQIGVVDPWQGRQSIRARHRPQIAGKAQSDVTRPELPRRLSDRRHQTTNVPLILLADSGLGDHLTVVGESAKLPWLRLSGLAGWNITASKGRNSRGRYNAVLPARCRRSCRGPAKAANLAASLALP